jgi:hypothetical protein
VLAQARRLSGVGLPGARGDCQMLVDVGVESQHRMAVSHEVPHE